MSLMIKGMNMPKSCKDCPCREYPKFSFESNWCCLNQKTISDVRVISPNCPLIEVPTPHGRLIDEEAIYNNVKSRCNNCHIRACAICGVTCILNDIRTAPTIIEAEVSE